MAGLSDEQLNKLESELFMAAKETHADFSRLADEIKAEHEAGKDVADRLAESKMLTGEFNALCWAVELLHAARNPTAPEPETGKGVGEGGVLIAFPRGRKGLEQP